MSNPLVSIIVNNHNYERFLAAAIDSALGQNYAPTEVIVVDDGSTDRSRQIIAGYGERVIPVLKDNGGQSSAFNAGFAASRGDIICFLDADDVFVEHKVATIAQVFNDNPDIGWCFHTLMLVDKDTEAVLGKTRAFPTKRGETARYDFRAAMKRGKLPFYPSPTSGLCLRRFLLEQILPMPITFMKTSADRYLRCAAVWLSPGVVLNEALTLQGLHGHNAATSRIHKQKLNEREIIVACLLRDRFPAIAKFSNRMFARGLNAYRKVEGADEYRHYISQYLSKASFLEKLEILLLFLYQNRFWKKGYSHELSQKLNQLDSPLKSV